LPDANANENEDTQKEKVMQIVTKRDWHNLRLEQYHRWNRPTLADYQGIRPRVYAHGKMPDVPPAHLYVKKIDRAEWPERIRDRIARRLFERTRPILPNHDQNGLSDCWCQGPVRAVEIVNYLEGRTPHLLSVESIVVPIDGVRDRGGNPEDAIRQLIQFGACDQALWPANKLSARHADPSWKMNRLENRIIRFTDLRDYDEQISFALHDLPHVVTLQWMSHCMCALDPELIGKNEVGLRLDNSWGDWGDKGTKVYDEQSATAGEAGAWGVLLTTMQPL
jgi:hypothetical protein